MENNNSFIHGIVLAETIKFMMETKTNNTMSPIFNSCELNKKYQNYLTMLTSLKEHIPDNFPELECQTEGWTRYVAIT